MALGAAGANRACGPGLEPTGVPDEEAPIALPPDEELEVPAAPPPTPIPGSIVERFCVRSFSSRRHFALRFENHTCNS